MQDFAKKVIFSVMSLAIILSGTAAGQYKHINEIDEKIGQTVPRDLIFLDEKGEKISLRQLTDKPVLISLVYFSCGRTCPLLIGNLAEALGETDNDPNDYNVITISFDDMDTPAVASEKKRNYLKAIGRPFPETSWRFLTGDSKTITDLTRSVGFSFSKENSGFSHPRALIFLSPEGSISRYLYGMSFSPFDIRLALKEASAGSRVSVADRLSLFCFSYDREENRYVFNLARSFACVVFLMMAALLAFLLSTRRKRGKR